MSRDPSSIALNAARIGSPAPEPGPALSNVSQGIGRHRVAQLLSPSDSAFELPLCGGTVSRIALPVFAARGSATSPTGCATLRVIAISPSSPSVPWNGAALSPMPWSRPMTGSSARPSGTRPSRVRGGAAMRAFRIRGQYCTILWPSSGPLARKTAKGLGSAGAAALAPEAWGREGPGPAQLRASGQVGPT